MKKMLMKAGLLVICALGVGGGMASTVAYWPMAGENGARMQKDEVIQNLANPGVMDAEAAYVRSYYGTVNDTSATPVVCYPMGTNAFPEAYGVYDPAAGANRAAATGLDFTARHLSKNWSSSGYCWWQGVLRVEDPDAIKTTSFTIEFFFRPEETSSGLWQYLAAMPMSNVANGSTGTESWSIGITNTKRIFAGFGMVDENGAQTGRKTFTSIALPQIYDGRWHHFAMTVDGTAMKMYVDYALAGSGTLQRNVQYKDDGDLFIGGTTHAVYSYYGSMAHFRISDEALASEEFLHFTQTARSEGVADDVALHIDFEEVEGISTNKVFFNKAAYGAAVHFGATNSTASAAAAGLDTDVAAGRLYHSHRDARGYANRVSLDHGATEGGDPHISWKPGEDVFLGGSFTFEMFLKATAIKAWSVVAKRRTEASDSDTQFWMGANGTANALNFGFGSSRFGDKAVVDGEWHHVALVYDAETKKMTYYRDRKQVGESKTATAGELAKYSVTKPLYLLGGQTGGVGTECKIDEVRLTKRLLSPREFLSAEGSKGFMIIIK